jgi:hypothetical protein
VTGRRLLGAVLVAATAPGCAEPPHGPIEACPILEADCQQRLFLATDRLRGRIWDPWSVMPRVEVVGRDIYRRRAEAIAAERPRAASSALWSGALQGLGVLAPGLDVATADQRWLGDLSLAYYDPHPNRVTIVDRGAEMDAIEATRTLVHEYVHALQDRDLGLDWGPVLTTDQEMVRAAMIEGEAGLFDQLARLEMEGVAPAEFDWEDHFGSWLVADRGFTPFAPSAHSHVRLSFPYPTGGAFLARTWRAGGVVRVQRLFTSHPRTFVELMLSAEGRPAPEAQRRPSCTSPRGVGGATVLSVDTLGAALLYAHLLHVFEREPEAWEAALGWRGDRIWLLDQRDGGPPATFWRVHAPSLATSPLGPLLRDRRDPPVIEGEDLLMWEGLAPALLEAAGAQLTCLP